MGERVCVLHVGGTIGMKATSRGLIPTRGYVERFLDAIDEVSKPELPTWEYVPLEPLLDSADMKPADWSRTAQAIVERHDEFDGFVVLHGTDTMVYTASAVSFLIRGQRKPIIFTGAQLPLSNPRSDGREHIITSMTLAARGDVPEVGLYFSDRLLRGNRAQKINNADFIAFDSGNCGPLARVGVDIQVDWSLVRSQSTKPLSCRTMKHTPQVASIRVYPGMTPLMLDRLLRPPLDAVVLETYGAGTFPSGDAELLAVVQQAVARGLVVVNCSQCHQGRVVQTLYGSGRALSDAGVVSGHDMTPEAALTKIWCLLGSGASPEEARRRIGEDIAGEITLPGA